jgi:DNA mismatch repair protein MutS
VPVKSTPLITQYLSVKQKVPDAILFFRLGDFYEMFFEDAEVGSRVLDIQLTSRSKDGVPLCGVPYHSAEPYIAKLLKAGFKVAICEQAASDGSAPGAENRKGAHPAEGDRLDRRHGMPRGLVPRQIVRVITPGTVGEEMVLTADQKNFLLALAPEGGEFALAALDVSTGEFIATRMGGTTGLREEIARLAPREIIVPAADAGKLKEALAALECPVTQLDPSMFSPPAPADALKRRFDAEAAEIDRGVIAVAGAALLYVEDTFGRDLAHLRRPRFYRATEYMLVDEVSRRHLELVVSSDGARRGSLLSVLDETLTAGGCAQADRRSRAAGRPCRKHARKSARLPEGRAGPGGR